MCITCIPEKDMALVGNREILGMGTTRVVAVESETTVIKVGSPNANQAEYELWKNHSSNPAVARHLFAVLEISEDGQWLIMERATMVLKEAPLSRDDRWKIVDDLGRKLHSVGAVIYDLHTGNIGRKADGTWAVLDYAG